jgi:thioester reductase-like protein
LTEKDANKFAAAILHPLASERISKVIGDVSKLGRELHEATKRNLAQLDLFRQDDPHA